MQVVIGSDHAGVIHKTEIISFLQSSWQCQVEDVGSQGPSSVDYPDIVYAACKKFLEGKVILGILLCGSGIGVSMAANRYMGVRCALVNSPELATLAKEHNNANFLAFGTKFMNVQQILSCLLSYKDAHYLGGRHQVRLEKIETLPQEVYKNACK